MTKIVYAAGLVAHKLHSGQMDKGGNDYFESHLLKVASRGFDWKEKVVGFLHDASEDCNVTVEDVLRMLDAEISKVVDNPEENWWEEWMEGIDVYLENNMDLTRIPQPTTKDFARVERYRREYEFLTNAFHNCVSG